MTATPANESVFGPIRSMAQSKDELAAQGDLRSWFFSEEMFLKHYEEILEPQSKPDLIGKSLQANENQYPQVYEMTREICGRLGIPTCLIYVRESYMYTADSEGHDTPRLELSARMIRDFTPQQLQHRIAKECYHIAAGHLTLEVLTEQLLKLINAMPGLPGLNLLNMFGGDLAFQAASFRLRSVAFKWFEQATYSAENFAVACTGDLEASVSATVCSVLGDMTAWDEVDLPAFLGQIEDIEACIGAYEAMDRMDEVFPYAPYRVRNMLNYALTDRAAQLGAYLGQPQSSVLKVEV